MFVGFGFGPNFLPCLPLFFAREGFSNPLNIHGCILTSSHIHVSVGAGLGVGCSEVRWECIVIVDNKYSPYLVKRLRCVAPLAHLCGYCFLPFLRRFTKSLLRPSSRSSGENPASRRRNPDRQRDPIEQQHQATSVGERHGIYVFLYFCKM